MDAMTAQARRFYHHVHHGGSLKESDVAAMVRAMEGKDATIARLTSELAEAREKLGLAYETAADVARDCYPDPQAESDPGYIPKAIRALDPDATAAIAARDKRVREEAYKEGWRFAHRQSRQTGSVHDPDARLDRPKAESGE